MTTMDLGADSAVGPGEREEPSYGGAYAAPKGCSCGAFDCDDVSIDVVASHLGIPVHPLAELIGDHLPRIDAISFEFNYRRTYGIR